MDHDELNERLRARGLRATRARLWILESLARRTDHPTADQILESARRSGHRLSTATLYQNLHRLAEAGLLRRFSGSAGVLRFEAQLAPHHHLVCERCGKVMDAQLDEDQVRRLQPVEMDSGAAIEGWTLNAVRIEICGLCPACQDER